MVTFAIFVGSFLVINTIVKLTNAIAQSNPTSNNAPGPGVAGANTMTIENKTSGGSQEAKKNGSL